MRRSLGVTVCAVVALIGAALTLLLGIIMLAVMIFVPTPTSAQMPQSPVVIKGIFLMGSLAYLLPAIWGISTGVGLLRLRNWARISMLVFSVLLVLMSVFSGLIALVLPLSAPPNSGLDPSVATYIRIVMACFWLSLLGIGLWWLIYFSRKQVKMQFSQSQSAPAGGTQFEGLPMASLQGPAFPTQSGSRTRPMSITVIAWLLLIGCLFTPFSIWMHAPAMLFTKLVTGWMAIAVFVTFAVFQFFTGLGLLHLHPIARQAAIAFFVFGLVNGTVFYFAPGGRARVLSLIHNQNSMFPWLPSNQTQFQVDSMLLFIYCAVLGLAVAAVPIFFLVTRKAAFMRNESDRLSA